MQKAQTIARDARTYVKRQAAAYEQQKAQLAHKMEEMKDRWIAFPFIAPLTSCRCFLSPCDKMYWFASVALLQVLK